MEIEGLRKIAHKICKKEKNTHGQSYKGYRKKHQRQNNPGMHAKELDQ